MANPERGEVSLDIGGTLYTLKSSINAAIEVEALFSQAEGRKVYWNEVLDAVNAGSMAHKRAVFWAMLRTHQPAITLAQAGDLSDILDQQTLTTALADTVIAGSPDARDVAEVTPKGRPQRAQAKVTGPKDGTGVASSSGLGASA